MRYNVFLVKVELLMQQCAALGAARVSVHFSEQRFSIQRKQTSQLRKKKARVEKTDEKCAETSVTPIPKKCPV